MARFLLDENMPRSLAAALRADALDVEDARDVGLRGRPDPEVLDYAKRHERVLITRDVEIASVKVYPLGSHAGVVLMRHPNKLTTAELRALLVPALRLLPDEDLRGNVVVLDPKRLRIRRKT